MLDISKLSLAYFKQWESLLFVASPEICVQSGCVSSLRFSVKPKNLAERSHGCKSRQHRDFWPTSTGTTNIPTVMHYLGSHHLLVLWGVAVLFFVPEVEVPHPTSLNIPPQSSKEMSRYCSRPKCLENVSKLLPDICGNHLKSLYQS